MGIMRISYEVAKYMVTEDKKRRGVYQNMARREAERELAELIGGCGEICLYNADKIVRAKPINGKMYWGIKTY